MKELKTVLLFAAFLCGSTFCLGQTNSEWRAFHKWSSSTVVCLNEKDTAALTVLAHQGDADAEDRLGTLYLSHCNGMYQPQEGVDLLGRAALHGNAHAQMELAGAYRSGIGIAKDLDQSVVWYEKSAAQGNARAQNDLGMMYLQGKGVPRDEARAAKLFTSAAEQDLSDACFNLALLYDEGRGVAQDYAAARKWYELAAERKDKEAEYRLSLLFDYGLGGPKDSVVATRWLRRAAEDGVEEARVALGLISPDQAPNDKIKVQIALAMLEGRHIPKDPQSAVKLLFAAAETESVPALLELAILYSDGEVVPKDEARAISYLERAVKKDPKCHPGYNNLAWLLVTSDELKLRNPQRALDYANRAIELNNKEPNYIDTLAHVYAALGNREKAMEAESRALSMKPDNLDYQKALAEFKSSRVK